MDRYLQETEMLNYSDSNIQRLILERKWMDLEEFERLKAIYNFVRDEILFGYNVDDSISASKVLKDGYGQCNTKGTLFMALLRACGIPCRVHGFTIDKALQKGAMTGIVYKNAPQNVFHSWVEVYFEDKWYELEAFILDKQYLEKLQKKKVIAKVHFAAMAWLSAILKIRLLSLTGIIHIFKARESIRTLVYMLRRMIC